MQQIIYRLFILLAVSLTSQFLSAQTSQGTIRGQVLDAISGAPIPDAQVLCLMGKRDSLKAITNEEGIFRLEGITAGRHRVVAEAPGYASYAIPDLVVSSGKERVLDITLNPVIYDADEVPIQANTYRDIRQVSTRVFTVEETRRYAAAYFDPARVATSYPGVTAANDQANHLIVRGNSPNGVGWRLEGVEIVNPNHLTNAGTFSDRISQSGGGTIILSTQLLDNSTFSAGAFAPRYGNALSSVFDIHLREGNNEQYEYTVQAGLIGVDLAAEGPISKQQGSSFLANYRYSTVGLLGALGIEFGNEEITYQDLSFNLHLPAGKAGTFTVFGMGGLSITRYFGSNVDTLQSGRDRFDIDFYSNMGAAGATHRKLLGQNTLWQTTVAFSGIESGRRGELITDTLAGPLTVENDEVLNSRLSAVSRIQTKLGTRSNLEAGLYYTRFFNRTLSQIRALDPDEPLRELASFEGNTDLLQPFVDWQWQASPQVTLNAGLHAMYYLFNQQVSLEPRLRMNWQVNAQHRAALAYGLHSQLQPSSLYFLSVPIEGTDEYRQPNLDLGFTRAHHLVASYQWSPQTDWRVGLEAYGQYLFDVPIAPGDTLFSALNFFEANVSDQLEGDSLVNQGEGLNYGLELTVERFLSEEYYFLLSGALYDSRYRSGGDIWLETRYNGRYQLAATGGYEHEWISKKGQNKSWGANLRVQYRGGFLAATVDLPASEASGRTVYDYAAGYNERLPDFFRVDFRVTFKRHRPNLTRTLGIDIQNLTNAQNVAFFAYDPVAGGVITRYQLGIIPLLSYRLEF